LLYSRLICRRAAPRASIPWSLCATNSFWQ
jgi:hypothetical protein